MGLSQMRYSEIIKQSAARQKKIFKGYLYLFADARVATATFVF